MPATSAPSQAIRAPIGTTLSCKGWHQEAALRMLMNNLDPDVAEAPEELIVYGGGGKAARNWQCYHAIVDTRWYRDGRRGMSSAGWTTSGSRCTGK